MKLIRIGVHKAVSSYSLGGLFEYLITPLYLLRNWQINRDGSEVIALRIDQLELLAAEYVPPTINKRSFFIICRSLFKNNPSGISNILWLIGLTLAKSGHKVTFIHEGINVTKRLPMIENVNFEAIPIDFKLTRFTVLPNFLSTWSIRVNNHLNKKDEANSIVLSTNAGLETLFLAPKWKQAVILVTNYSLVDKYSSGRVSKRSLQISKLEKVFLQNTNIIPIGDSYSIISALSDQLCVPELKKVSAICPLFWPLPKIRLQKKKYVTFLGRLEKRKGAAFLISAWNLIPVKDRSGWTLVLIGPPGDDFAALKLISEADDSIIWKGQLNEKLKNEYLSQTSIFVQPSFFESFGLTTLEAMLNHCLVIASDCGANSELIDDRFLYDSNSANSLAMLLVHYMNDTSAIQDGALLAFEKARSDFTPEVFSQNFDLLLGESWN